MSANKIVSSGGNEVHCFSSGKSVPQLLKESVKGGKSSKRSKEWTNRAEVLQDFEFETHSTRVKVSRNGEFVAAVGAYPPEVRVFETSEHSMKFRRRFDAEIVDFMMLTEGYEKMVFLRNDRGLEFHDKGGKWYSYRVPHFGRALEMVSDTADLWVVGTSSDVVRLDLNEGRFDSSGKSSVESLNCVKANPFLPAVFTGGSEGVVEAWDIRTPNKPVAKLTCMLPDEISDIGTREITCLDFSSRGLHMAVGTSAGVCRVYDLRSSRPLAERDHSCGMPIVDLHVINKTSLARKEDNDHRDFVAESSLTSSGGISVVSADAQYVRIWSVDQENLNQEVTATSKKGNTKLHAAFETQGAINSVCPYPKSGMIFVAQDSPRIGLYFVPAVGLAPGWCPDIDRYIEEDLNDTSNKTGDVFAEYRFVTRDELERWDCVHLIGTELTRPCMHGWFMDKRLYDNLRQEEQGVDVETYRKAKVQETLEAKRKMRQVIKSSETKQVNSKMAQDLEEKAKAGEKETNKKTKRSADRAKRALADERFKAMFQNKDFAIQEIDA